MYIYIHIYAYIANMYICIIYILTQSRTHDTAYVTHATAYVKDATGVAARMSAVAGRMPLSVV